jgi:hypothetical protein
MFEYNKLMNYVGSHPVLSQFGKKGSHFGLMKQSKAESSSPAPSVVYIEKCKPESLILQSILIAIALYFAMKCKKDNNIDFLQIILALLCAPFYIIYRIVYPCS